MCPLYDYFRNTLIPDLYRRQPSMFIFYKYWMRPEHQYWYVLLIFVLNHLNLEPKIDREYVLPRIEIVYMISNCISSLSVSNLVAPKFSIFFFVFSEHMKSGACFVLYLVALSYANQSPWKSHVTNCCRMSVGFFPGETS